MSVSIPRALFFNDTAPTEIYTLSLHDALPISLGGGDVGLKLDRVGAGIRDGVDERVREAETAVVRQGQDRKSTRLNSSHLGISYAVFCLKKKTTQCLA